MFSASRPAQAFVEEDDDDDDGEMDEGMDPVPVTGGMGMGMDNIQEEEGEYDEGNSKDDSKYDSRYGIDQGTGMQEHPRFMPGRTKYQNGQPQAFQPNGQSANGGLNPQSLQRA